MAKKELAKKPTVVRVTTKEDKKTLREIADEDELAATENLD